jgi:hypothetical protein
MGEVSTQQVYDLALKILCDVAKIEASLDELLLEVRSLNRDMSLGRSSLSEAFPK